MENKIIVNSILVVLPSNIGDILLTLPAINLMRKCYGNATLCLLCSPHTCTFVKKLNLADETFVFDKKWSLYQKFSYLLPMRKKYDACVDFKNSIVPYFVNAKFKTTFIRPKRYEHKTQTYVKLTQKALRIPTNFSPNRELNIDIENSRVTFFEELLEDKRIFIAPGTKSRLKQYPAPKMAELINFITKKEKVVLIGAPEDTNFVADIKGELQDLEQVIDLVGKTTFEELFFLIDKYAKALLGCDSAPMHVGSFLNVPVVALFGPTDPIFYGPYSDKSLIVRAQDLDCVGCMKSSCDKGPVCMDQIEPNLVYKKLMEIICQY